TGTTRGPRRPAAILWGEKPSGRRGASSSGAVTLSALYGSEITGDVHVRCLCEIRTIMPGLSACIPLKSAVARRAGEVASCANAADERRIERKASRGIRMKFVPDQSGANGQKGLAFRLSHPRHRPDLSRDPRQAAFRASPDRQEGEGPSREAR